MFNTSTPNSEQKKHSQGDMKTTDRVNKNKLIQMNADETNLWILVTIKTHYLEAQQSFIKDQKSIPPPPFPHM
jgi:hypothetical protein